MSTQYAYTMYNSALNIYYIHLHKQNIGKLSSSWGSNIEGFIQSHQQDVITATKMQYKEHFLKSALNGQESVLSTIGTYIDLVQDDNFNKLVQQIENQVSKTITNQLRNSSTELSQTYQDIYSQSLRVSERVNSMVTGLTKDNKDIGALNFQDMLEAIQKSIELLSSYEGASYLLAAIDNNKTLKGTQGHGLASMGQVLTRVVKNFQEEASKNGCQVDPAIEGIAKQLKNTANLLKKSSGKSLKQQNNVDSVIKSLSTSINNVLMSTNIGEAAQGLVTYRALQSVYNGVEGPFLSGTKSYYNPITNQKIVGKTDWSVQGIPMKIEWDSNEGLEFTMNLGFSGKLYNNIPIIQKPGNIKGYFEAGSGGSLKEAFQTIFGNNVDGQYIARNLIAHPIGENSTGALALQDLIMKRQILRLISTSGANEDFSQLIFVNGEILSVYEIMNYVLEHYMGRSLSMQKDTRTQQGIGLSIKGRTDILKSNTRIGSANSLIDAWNRSKIINGKIDSAKIEVSIHVNKMIKALGHQVWEG